jgi:hypothetical protein
MGTSLIINDTLQITKEQGFPVDLDIENHNKSPYSLRQFENKIFEFRDKEGIRAYQAPPVRVFLCENLNGKWLYWGLCHVLETRLDLVKKETSGKFKIIKLFTVEEMKDAFEFVDTRPEFNYFE